LERRKQGCWILKPQGRQYHVFKWINEELKGSSQIWQDEITLKEILKCDPEDICRKQRGG